MLTETFSDFTRSNFLQLRYLAVLSETIEEVMSLTPSDGESLTLVICSGKLSTAHDLTVVPTPFDVLLKNMFGMKGRFLQLLKLIFSLMFIISFS